MEILDVLNENREIIGKEERSKIHEQGLWHIHVGIWLMNEKGELLFQQRSKSKKINPGKWTRTGGHLDSGETPVVGIQREVEEEIGLKLPIEDFELMEIEKRESYNKELDMYDRFFVYAYFAFTDAKIEDLKLQVEEVSNVKYITIEEMEEAYNRKDPNYSLSHWDNFNKKVEYLKNKRATLK